MPPEKRRMPSRSKASTVPESDAPQCFLVPIDACYEFVGGLRLRWRGFDGGARAHEFVDGFFARVAGRSRTVSA